MTIVSLAQRRRFAGARASVLTLARMNAGNTESAGTAAFNQTKKSAGRAKKVRPQGFVDQFPAASAAPRSTPDALGPLEADHRPLDARQQRQGHDQGQRQPERCVDPL